MTVAVVGGQDLPQRLSCPFGHRCCHVLVVEVAGDAVVIVGAVVSLVAQVVIVIPVIIDHKQNEERKKENIPTGVQWHSASVCMHTVVVCGHRCRVCMQKTCNKNRNK